MELLKKMLPLYVLASVAAATLTANREYQIYNSPRLTNQLQIEKVVADAKSTMGCNKDIRISVAPKERGTIEKLVDTNTGEVVAYLLGINSMDGIKELSAREDVHFICGGSVDSPNADVKYLIYGIKRSFDFGKQEIK